MSEWYSWPSKASPYPEVGPQNQRLHSQVTEDKFYWVYLAPDGDSFREHRRRAAVSADRVAVVRRLTHPELPDASSPRDSWRAFSMLIAEPSAHTRSPSASLIDFHAGSRS
jgi:hypothetical protein